MEVGQILRQSVVYPIFSLEYIKSPFDLKDMIKAVAEAGVKIIQLREKNFDTKMFIEHAKKYVSFAQQRGLLCLINDNIEVALRSNADGAHIGRSDMPVAKARELLGNTKILGLSLEYITDLDKKNHSEVSYIAAAAFFSKTKKLDHIHEAKGIKEIHDKYPHLPLVAIGGINLDNIASIANCCTCAAVVSAICDATDPHIATVKLRETFIQYSH